MQIRLGLHNHSQMSDGYFTVGGLLRYLKDSGYDVIAITDHNAYTVPHPIQIRENKVEDLLILRGIEVTFPRIHMICLEPIRYKTVMDCLDTARISYIAHPSFSGLNPFDCHMICDKYHLDGVEIYNSGHINFKGDSDGNFYAGDDLHIPSQVMTSWIEMDVDGLDKETVLEKLKTGNYELFNKPQTCSRKRSGSPFMATFKREKTEE